MTHNEAIILSAYTGFLLVEDFSDVHKFCEELLGRPIFTSEFADDLVLEEIREKCKPLIIEIQKPKTNYEHIRNMSVEEMAEFINKNYKCRKCAYYNKCCDSNCESGIKLWLMKEVSENETL